MALKLTHILLYVLISGIFLNSGKSEKIVSKSETILISVAKQNPASLETFQRLLTEKNIKIKGHRHSVHSLEPENLFSIIGLRKKHDTPKVVYFTTKTSRPVRSH